MDSRHYRPLGIGVTELAPDQCPAGHELGPGRVLIGCMPCLCAGQSHRIWMCVTCRQVLAWPACTFHPEWTVWEGVDPEARTAEKAIEPPAHAGQVRDSSHKQPCRGSWSGDPGDWFG